MQREEVQFQLGHSRPQREEKYGIRALGTSACKRLLEYAQNPSAEYRIVRDFIFSNSYSSGVEFDSDELSKLDEEQISDCMLVLRLSCIHPDHFDNVILADWSAWEQLELTHVDRRFDWRQGQLDFGCETRVTTTCASSASDRRSDAVAQISGGLHGGK